MAFETNDYVMCMKCQTTHHEDEDHVCDEENPLVPRAFDLIKQTPGIDTPQLCLMLHWPPMPDPNLRGPALAKWLSTHHDCAWEETCDAVDRLLNEGDISFSDDGELRANGY